MQLICPADGLGTGQLLDKLCCLHHFLGSRCRGLIIWGLPHPHPPTRLDSCKNLPTWDEPLSLFSFPNSGMLEEHCSEGLALLEKHESTGEVTHGQDGRSETVGPKKKSLHWPPKSWPLFMATAVLVYIAVVLTVIAANLTVSRLQRLRPTYCKFCCRCRPLMC